MPNRDGTGPDGNNPSPYCPVNKSKKDKDESKWFPRLRRGRNFRRKSGNK